MSSNCDLSHAHAPRNPRLVAINLLFVFRSQTSEIKFVTTLTCRVCDQGPYLHPSSLVEHSLHALEFAPDDLLMNGVNLLLKYRNEQIQMFVIKTLDFFIRVIPGIQEPSPRTC